MAESIGSRLRRRLERAWLAVWGRRDAVRDLPQGAARVFTTLDHYDVGRMYVVFAVAMGLLGGLDAMAVRATLVTPDTAVWSMDSYNAFFTTHGLTMLFLFATPAFFGLANVLLPPLVGAPDMAFPRVNALAFWLLPPAALLMRADLLVAVVAPFTGLAPMHPGTGWTLYAPLSVQIPNFEVDLLLLGLHLSGLATILASINVIVTVVACRAEEVTWANLDIFSWAFLTTAGMATFAFPVLGAALLMLLGDRNFGTAFFTVDGGGPLLWQHLFWFFAHPEVYILVLPAMGVLSLLIPAYSGRDLFGFRYVVYSTLAIGALGFGVWVHHMFTTGMDPRVMGAFMVVTLAVAVPSAVKTFNWMATLWNGRIRLTVPMLFCVAAVANFVVGGVTGVFLASVPVNRWLNDTYYVVAHFHFMLVGMTTFAAFAAVYHWFPFMTGRWYDGPLARLHFWLTQVGVVWTFLPLFVLGYMGHPRRYATYLPEFAPFHQVATVGAFVLGFAQLVWLWNVVRSTAVGDRVETGDPWNLAADGQLTREWDWFADRFDLPMGEPGAGAGPPCEVDEFPAGGGETAPGGTPADDGDDGEGDGDAVGPTDAGGDGDAGGPTDASGRPVDDAFEVARRERDDER